MTLDHRTVQQLANALGSGKDSKSVDIVAGTVTRTESDGTVWVRFDGAETDTPCVSSTASASDGDRVSVTVSGGTARVSGNETRPATDDSQALKAQSMAASAQDSAESAKLSAEKATGYAVEAQASAGIAHDAAVHAEEDAQTAANAAQYAQDSLKSVVTGATTVEKAVSVMQTALEAVVDYDPDTDTTQEYFWHDANGAHVLGDTSGYRNDIDSSGMSIKEVMTENTIAHFGADGSQICGSDAVPLFDIDTNGSNTTTVNTQVKTYWTVAHDSIEFSDSTSYELPSAKSGTALGFGWMTFYFGSRVYDVSFDADNAIGINDYSGGAEVRSVNVGVPGDNLMLIRSRAVSTLTVGTSGTLTCGVSNIGLSIDIDGITYSVTLAYSLSIIYDGASTVTFSASLTFTGAAPEEIDGLALEQDHGNYINYTATISAPIYSLGTREPSADKGDFSAIIGEGLIAASDDQLAIGRYNVADTDDTCAVIIGNGTADNDRSNAFAVKWNGDMVIADHDSEVGELRETDISTSVNVAVSTYTALGSIALSKGTWVITGGISYASGAAGMRYASLTTKSGSTAPTDAEQRSSTQYVYNYGTNSCRLNVTRVVKLTASVTYYLKAWQNGVSGGLDATGNLRAVRIK